MSVSRYSSCTARSRELINVNVMFRDEAMMFEREFFAIVLNFVLITSSPLVAQPMNENAGFVIAY